MLTVYPLVKAKPAFSFPTYLTEVRAAGSPCQRAGMVIINPGGSWPALLPALLGIKGSLPSCLPGLALPRPGSAQRLTSLPARGEENHSKHLNFSLQFTDRFLEMLKRGEGIGSKICRGTRPGLFQFSCTVS